MTHATSLHVQIDEFAAEINGWSLEHRQTQALMAHSERVLQDARECLARTGALITRLDMEAHLLSPESASE